jgi:hypothetical protein
LFSFSFVFPEVKIYNSIITMNWLATGEGIQRSPGSLQREEQRKNSTNSHINGGQFQTYLFPKI